MRKTIITLFQFKQPGLESEAFDLIRNCIQNILGRIAMKKAVLFYFKSLLHI
jgi:hypothetical protein